MIDSQAGSSCLNASKGVDGHFKEIPVAVGESSLGVNFFVLNLFEEGKQDHVWQCYKGGHKYFMRNSLC